MLPSKYLKIDKMCENVIFLMKKYERFYGSVILKSVLIKDKNKSSDETSAWFNGLTKIVVLGKKETPKSENTQIMYNNCILIKKILDLNGLISLIKNCVRTKKFKIEEAKIPVVEGGNRIFWSSNNRYYSWSGYLFNLSNREQVDIPSNPLLKYDQPLFTDGFEAIREWIDIRPFWNHSDADLGKILIFLPEYRAKIKELLYAEEKLSIAIESKVSLNHYRIKFWCRTGSGREVKEDTILENKYSSVKIPLDSKPIMTRLYLLSPNDELIDYRETPIVLGQKPLVVDAEKVERI